MKKASILILLILICCLGYGQTYPLQQNVGNTPTTKVKTNALEGKIIITAFTDTSAANSEGYLKNYDGAVIKTTTPINALWYRVLDSAKWVQILPTGGGTGGIRAWLDGGNYNVLADGQGNAVFGTLGKNGIKFTTQAIPRFILDSAGILSETGSTIGIGYDPSNGNRLTQYSGGGGTVTSVTGTTNRITSTGGANPIINISPSYDDSVKSWINIASGNIIDTSYYSNLYSKSLGAYSGASTTYNNIFFGSQSGKLTTIGEYHDNIFMGNQSGKFGATIVYVTNSNFLGNYAGSNSYNAYNSNFFGKYTGSNSANAANSNFMGEESGVNATNASNSNFFGNFAGNSSTNASNSNFFGNSAGNSATNASNSNFFGNSTGYGATNADHCNFFGYGTGRAFPGNNVGSNNIIIGTNISLPDATTDAINIGAILFGKNTNSDGIGDPKIVPSTNGKIGILVVNPDSTLHVAGSGHFRDYLRVEKADSISSPTNMLTMASDGTIKKAAVPSGGGSGVNSVSGTVNRISIAGTSSDPIIGISAAYDDTVKNWISDSIDNNAVTFRNPNSGDTLLTNPATNTLLVKSLIAGTNVTFAKTDTTITINASGGGSSTTTTDNRFDITSNVLTARKTPLSLTDGATITWNAATGYNARVTIAGNRTLSITNPQAGDYYTLTVIQDGTGFRGLTLPNGGAASLNLKAGDSTTLTAYYRNTGWEWRSSAEQCNRLMQRATYTLTSSTASQKIFNVTTNGAIYVEANTTYKFTCYLDLSSMSATSGNAKFDMLGAGTATIALVRFTVNGMDATTPTSATTTSGCRSTATITTGNMVTAQTGTAMYADVMGEFTTGTGGTIIPSVALTTAAAAVVGIGTTFSVVKKSDNTATSNGNVQ